MSTTVNGSENKCANCNGTVEDEFSKVCDDCMGTLYGDMR